LDGVPLDKRFEGSLVPDAREPTVVVRASRTDGEVFVPRSREDDLIVTNVAGHHLAIAETGDRRSKAEVRSVIRAPPP